MSNTYTKKSLGEMMVSRTKLLIDSLALNLRFLRNGYIVFLTFIEHKVNDNANYSLKETKRIGVIVCSDELENLSIALVTV